MVTTALNVAAATKKPGMSSITSAIPLPIDKPTFLAAAVYVGEHIDLHPFLHAKRIPAQQPAVTGVKGGGLAILYRYGAIVFFDVSPTRQGRFLHEVRSLIRDPYEQPETEELRISISKQESEGDIGEAVILRCGSLERLEAVAAVLSKSVALAQYESDVAMTLDRIEPFAVQLEQFGQGGRNMRLLLRHIGRVLLNEMKMVARAEVTDRPDLIWEHPEMEQLYRRLEEEFELQERAAILDRKLELISRTVETVLDLLQKRRSVRVEWYIVVLIVMELALTLYQIFMRAT